MQPNHYIGTQHLQTTEADGTTNNSTPGPQCYAVAAVAGHTLQLTFNYSLERRYQTRRRTFHSAASFLFTQPRIP